jgi:competence protein ComEC
MPLKIHFLNVGQGDCTIIEFPSGRVAMVDIDNLPTVDPETFREVTEEYQRSLDYLLAQIGGFAPRRDLAEAASEFLRNNYARVTDPLAYYDTHIGHARAILRLIITHPDMDHMTGLHRLYEQEKRPILNFWHSGLHDFNLTKWGDSFRFDERDWETYKKLRAGATGGPTSLQRHQGDVGDFWTPDGIEILAPTPALEQLAIDKDESNIISTVLKITHAGQSILLGGDATSDETWPEMYANGLVGHVDVLKASHHGRETGYYGPAVKVMAPVLTITSVAEAEHDATPNYRRYSDYTVSLRRAGNIRITIEDDGRITYDPSTVAQHWKTKTD